MKDIEKIRAQLGMHPVTARSRLMGDLLFSFIEKEKIPCWRCGKTMSRKDFSIEHKIPWLHAVNAKELYFDLRNITFSHLFCNAGASRKLNKKIEIDHGNHFNFIGRRRICRCDACREAWNRYKRERYTPEGRKEKYLRTGT